MQLKNKTIVLTGATSGIGKITADRLVNEGAQLIMLNRDPDKTRKLHKELNQKHKVDLPDPLIADLSNLEQVSSAADKIANAYSSIDQLINNAGLIADKKLRITDDGHELTYQVNHLSHFLLLQKLLPSLKKSKNPKVLYVASEAHRGASINWKDIELIDNYNFFKAYANSKLFNIMIANRLSEIEPNLQSYSLHPGAIASGFGMNLTGWRKLMMLIARPFMINKEKGAENTVFLSTTENLSIENGSYVKKKKPKKPMKIAFYQDAKEKLWSISQEQLKTFLQ